jgi:Asp/Glu/hydantoin racemase
MTVMVLLSVINPNTDVTATAFMARIVADTVGGALEVEGRTVAAGPVLVTSEDELARAAGEVAREGERAAADGACGILVSGFGDPGLGELRRRLSIPVTGIAEAAMAAAASGNRRFAVVTTTPSLERSIAATAVRYGHGHLLAAVRVTPGRPTTVMADAQRLADALLAQCRRTIEDDGVEAIVIGGGPLALAAHAIRNQVAVPLVEPVRAGALLAAARLGALGPCR